MPNATGPAELWYELTRDTVQPCPRPVGSPSTVFTTLRPATLTPAQWTDHALRLGTAPDWLKGWDASLINLPQLAAGSPWHDPTARVVHDPQLQRIWISLQTPRAAAQRILLQPALGSWPDYLRKWWQREHYLRQAPAFDGATRIERLLVDQHSLRLWETDTANVLVEKHGQLYTPDPEGAPLLYGTALRQLARTRHIMHARLTLADAQTADAVWICNALLGLQRAELARD